MNAEPGSDRADDPRGRRLTGTAGIANARLRLAITATMRWSSFG